MRIAIIDLGTNTCNLLIADIIDSNWTTVFKNKAAVKLGEGGITKNEISEAAYQRGLDSLIKHKANIDAYKVDKTYAFATSATRGASNGPQFVAAVKEKTGIAINIIDGKTEAELIYYGVRQATNITSKCLIMDIGGGSTEFIIADGQQVHFKKSYDLGAARLLAMFNPNDPITETEIATIKNFLKEEVKDLLFICKQNKIKHLIGSSGSFDSLASVITKMKYPEVDLKSKTDYTFKLADYYEIHNQLLKSNLNERYNMDGLSTLRAEMIVLAILFIELIIDELEINKMQLSTYALKEGAIAKVVSGEF